MSSTRSLSRTRAPSVTGTPSRWKRWACSRPCTRCCPHLREHGGSLVHLGSAGDAWFPVHDGLSVLPKAANEALVRGIAKEEGQHGVRANSVLVGVIDAGMFRELKEQGVVDAEWEDRARALVPMRRWGNQDDVGHAAVFLASEQAGYITGQQISVSGGFGV
ncbi:SDR family NAD(P)-dependent oxidoreductase [Streptomyces antnestii]|uniref:SDR family NAD(P)-dependent oxidoreductase n=1 Tax=Streptomyces antnestii TaxID=2494256 RepID=UPI003D665BBE